MEGNGENGESCEIFKMIIGGGGENAGIYGKSGVAKAGINSESGDKGMGHLKRKMEERRESEQDVAGRK